MLIVDARTDGPGLQVSRDVDPPHWMDVPYIPGGFVINLGDLMRRWSGDLWLSTLHRVVIPPAEDVPENASEQASFSSSSAQVRQMDEEEEEKEDWEDWESESKAEKEEAEDPEMCTAPADLTVDADCGSSAGVQKGGGGGGGPREVARRRQSIAFFLNVNRDAVVETLPSDRIAVHAAASGLRPYDPIVAGDFLLLKHLAAQTRAG